MSKNANYKNYVALTLNEIMIRMDFVITAIDKVVSKVLNTTARDNLANYFNQKAVNDESDYYLCGMNIYRT